METIKVFPFDKWLLEDIDLDEFKQLARLFPGNEDFVVPLFWTFPIVISNDWWEESRAS